MEFVIYLGKKRMITVSDTRLSGIYRFEKNIPVPIRDPKDRKWLLSYAEKSDGCGSCGKAYTVRPMTSDSNYCRYNSLDLEEFRKKWEDIYKTK